MYGIWFELNCILSTLKFYDNVLILFRTEFWTTCVEGWPLKSIIIYVYKQYDFYEFTHLKLWFIAPVSVHTVS